ncbi:hypothetical protein [Brevundimonas guildfordensis]|uniref:Haem-binding uptake Tiki superfamily ChaN domain-containing protein n=1 Tax=Brevundimonas guildfordensis TaxID=2762241 RepID=A0ABR8QZS9_9CAUL|nr:hypothetical protein [Brevundimonas guildfordensis]MBD7941013.1 hypothetical protein [Brevundimonas guildfordensis]
MIATLLTAALVSSSTCAPVPGAEALWNDDTRYVVVGEMHGTTETPAAFAALVCAARAQGPVTVALEFSESMQPTLDAFMAADSDEAARSLLAAYPHGPFVHHDGRGSMAMLDLLLRLRAMQRETPSLKVIAFAPDSPRVAGFSQSYYELDMGHRLASAARRTPDSRMMILVGNIHAQKRMIESRKLTPAVVHLPSSEVISLYVVQQGGTTWSCGRDTCGANPLPEAYDAQTRGVVLQPYGGGAFDGVLALGPTTASEPAKP